MNLFRPHPPGLAVCFAVELWERFSYYGMRALLVFYLTRHFLFTDADSYLVYGAYTAMVYLTPVLGGLVADRYLGAQKAVRFGAVLLVLGHLGLALESSTGNSVPGAPASLTLDAFYLSLALITTGVGFLKTNTASLVGTLYPAADPRRDAGFTIYYMGINVGGAAAPLVCGWLGETYGWQYGFGVAGIGMVIGLAAFLRGRSLLANHGAPSDPEGLRRPVLLGVSRETATYVACLAAVAVVWVMLRQRTIIGPALAIAGTVTGAFILYYALAHCTRLERDRLLVCAILIAFTIGFWSFYEQMGSSLNLFADRFVTRVVLGREIPAATLQALPSIYVILLAPLFSDLWVRLGEQEREPSTGVKFTLAIASCGAAFLVLAAAAQLAPSSGRVPLVFFAVNFLLLVTGELCLAPVGMSMVSRLAPTRIGGFMMGVFLLAYSASSYIAGLIAQLTSADTINGVLVDRATALARYAVIYERLGVLALALALLLLVISPVLRRYARERDMVPAGAPQVATA